MSVTLHFLSPEGIAWAQRIVTEQHYLHAPVDARCSVQGYAVQINGTCIGYLLLGRPEATRCYPWYGSLDDIAAGRAACSRWEVLNLARVWLEPSVQAGGSCFDPELVPGFTDRMGRFRSTLASTALGLLTERVGFDYLLSRPPCFLDEPYQIRWLLSYCSTATHRGTIYRAAGWERYRTNDAGLQTWRTPLPPLTAGQDAAVRKAAMQHPRSIAYRSQRLAAATTQQGQLL